MSDVLPFGADALIIVAIYVLSLLFIGFYAYRQRQTDDMQDFFLAGRNLGFTILFLTLYATQYSG
ncbi:MAG: sodium:solute symporter family protein, partial [Nitrospinota bacterium]|nr:sodium:solute symporter family protein [Nitrospinota bacterium]